VETVFWSKEVIRFILVALVVSVAANLLLIISNDVIFLEDLQIEAVNKQLAGTNLSEFIGEDHPPIEMEIDWPWYSLLFYYGTYIFYWIFFGKVSWRFLDEKRINISLVIPILTSLLFKDLVFLLYLIATYSGKTWGKLSQQER
jgi:hypothetical protein